MEHNFFIVPESEQITTGGIPKLKIYPQPIPSLSYIYHHGLCILWLKGIPMFSLKKLLEIILHKSTFFWF